FVTSVLLEEMSEDKLSEVYKRLFNSPSIYADTVPFEWNWRVVSKLEKTISDKIEMFNIVTAINRINAEIKEGNTASLIDRVEITLDINSVPSNTDYRFDKTDVNSFLMNVKDWHND